MRGHRGQGQWRGRGGGTETKKTSVLRYCSTLALRFHMTESASSKKNELKSLFVVTALLLFLSFLKLVYVIVIAYYTMITIIL